MYLIAIAWGYVALMMALAEATSSQGSVLGAIITFVLYGLLPISIVMYLMGSPSRRAARKKQEQIQAQLDFPQEPTEAMPLDPLARSASASEPHAGLQADLPIEPGDDGHHAPGPGVMPVGKKP